MRYLKNFGLILSVIASPALGQTPSGQTCLALANTIATGYTTSFSDRDFQALRYYASCEAKDDSGGGGLSIGYAGFNLGGNYSEAHSSQLCKESKETVGIHDTEYNNAKIIFTQSLATIDRCLELSAKDWDIKFAQVGKDAVSL